MIGPQTKPTSHPFLIILTCMAALTPQISRIKWWTRCFGSLGRQQSNRASNLLSRIEIMLFRSSQISSSFDMPPIPEYHFQHGQFSLLPNDFYLRPKHRLQPKLYHQLPARMFRPVFPAQLQTQRRASSHVFWNQIPRIHGARWSFCRCLKDDFFYSIKKEHAFSHSPPS